MFSSGKEHAEGGHDSALHTPAGLSHGRGQRFILPQSVALDLMGLSCRRGGFVRISGTNF